MLVDGTAALAVNGPVRQRISVFAVGTIISNAVAAAIAGVTAYYFGPIVVFWLLAAMAVASIIATLSIPPDAIDHPVARGLDDTAGAGGPPPGVRAGDRRTQSG